jgi:hypothetical protein
VARPKSRSPADIEAAVEAACQFLELRKGSLKPRSDRARGYLGDLRQPAQAARVVELARGGDAAAHLALRYFMYAALKKTRPVLRYAEDFLVDDKVPKFRRARPADALLSRDFTIADFVEYVHGLGFPVAGNPGAPLPEDCAVSIVGKALERFGIRLSGSSIAKIFHLRRMPTNKK